MERVLIIGASSGIGEALAREFSLRGYVVGMASRRIELLNRIKQELPNTSYVKHLDLLRPDEARLALRELISEMGGADIIVINSGVGHENAELVWELERPSIDVNVLGFTAMAVEASNYFIKKGRGHLVGISSVAGLRPFRLAPAYGASKAFIIFYLKGLRHKFKKQGVDVVVTDIRPGFVDTPLTEGNTKMFWVSTSQKAAEQIFNAIKARKEVAYITKRWRLIAFIIGLVPDFIYNRL